MWDRFFANLIQVEKRRGELIGSQNKSVYIAGADLGFSKEGIFSTSLAHGDSKKLYTTVWLVHSACKACSI